LKERVTLTIEKELLLRVDEKIDGTEFKNRSHIVELLLLKALSSNRPRTAIILAGGESEQPKSMNMIHNRPVLEWNIELLKNHGVKEIMLCINKSVSVIKEYFGDGERFGIKISYYEEEFPLGTAGSVLAVKDFVLETTIICNADELKNIDLDDMYEFHKHNNKTCTIALTTVNDPSRFGVALMNGSRIIAFIEKPTGQSAPSKLVNAGLYLIEPEVLKYVPDGFSTLEQDVFPKLAKQDKLFGYVFSGQWFSTKTKESYDTAQSQWKGLV
jgi:NDP-sugar pyrophosphorylase family protein